MTVKGSEKWDEEQGKQRAGLEQRKRNGDIVLRGSSSGAPRSRQGGSGPLRSSSSAPMVSPRKTRHQIGVWIGKDQATTMRKGERGHWCVLSPLRQITEQVRGKTASSCTVAASVRGGRRSWKQLQRGSVAHGGELGRGDDGVLPRTGAAWHRGSRAASTSRAQRRGASQGVQERRRRRLPWTAVFTAPAIAPAPSRRRRPWLGAAS
jgi:hypothetical protein